MAIRTPKAVFTGRDRQVLKKLERALYLIENMDSRLQYYFETTGNEVQLFNDSTRLAQAINRIQDQITALLALKK